MRNMKRNVMLIAILLAVATLAHAYGPNPEHKSIPSGWLVPPEDNHDSAHSYDARFYRIDLNLPMNNAAMQAHEQTVITSRTTGLDSVVLDMNSLVCDSVKIAGAPAVFTTPTNYLVVTLDRAYNPGESLAIDVWYHRNSGTPLRGFYWYTRNQSGHHVVAYETTEPSDARYWFPCFDEPWDKAEQGCAVDITVPDSLTACSNGLLDSVTANSSAYTKTFWWSEHNPISTYLVTFAASKFSVITEWFHLSPTESTYIQNFVWPEDSVSALSAFAHNVDMITFYSDSNRYGRYPFEKYGMDEVYPFQWGGMENQTMTMIHHQWVEYGDDNGIAHEMSHQWWGDRTTCLDWRNVWLNEGFATFSAATYDYHENGHADFISLMQDDASQYFSEEAQMFRPVYDPPYPDHLFDYGHTYAKGNWVQHMLRFVEGDTVLTQPGIFYKAMRTYGDSFKYGNANTDDYCRIHEQVTGMDLSWFFNEWIYDAGYPQYTVNWHSVPEGGNYRVYVDIAQNNGTGAPTCFHEPLQVAIHMTSGDTLVTIPITANPQSVDYLISHNASSLVVDPGTWDLCTSTVYMGIENATAPELAQPLVAAPTMVRNSSRIRYTVGRPGRVNLEIVDAAGRVVSTLVSGQPGLGTHYVTWNAGTVAPGVYFCRLATQDKTDQVKLVVTR
jgi:aminopeptidase N